LALGIAAALVNHDSRHVTKVVKLSHAINGPNIILLNKKRTILSKFQPLFFSENREGIIREKESQFPTSVSLVFQNLLFLIK
jgi:hypothetical protein